MIADEMLKAVQPIVTSVADDYGRKNRAHGADSDDFVQELWCWVLANQDTVALWLDPECTDPKVGEKLLAKSLRNEALDYALDIKAQAVGYDRSDLYFYSKGEVKALLPAVFNPDAWDEPPQSEGRSTKSPSEGGNWIATLADIARAYEILAADDKEILAGFHRDGWNNKMMAEAAQMSESLMSYYHDRAVTRLVKELGGAAPRPMREGVGKDPWRGRHAVTNSAARAMTNVTYDDE